MARGTRQRIATGVYADQSGFGVVVSVRGVSTELRFPPGTPIREMKAWRAEERARRTLIAPAKPVRGTLKRDAERYIQQVRYLASWRERRAELHAWTVLYGDVRRRLITAEHVRKAMTLWHEATPRVAAKTINNRLQTLRHLYRTLDGTRASTPCDDVPLMPVPRTVATVVSPATILKVAATLERRELEGKALDAKTRARFMVLAATGKRASELMRAQPQDVDLTRRVWAVRDGKGGVSAGAYLNDDMLAAWRLFMAADAWGPFITSSFARTLRKAGWPVNVRPYNLRHSFGIALSERGEDLADIQAMMGHKQIATTRRHYVPVLNSRLQKASEGLDGRFNWPPATPHASPDATDRDTGGTGRSPQTDERDRRGDRAAGVPAGNRRTPSA